MSELQQFEEMDTEKLVSYWNILQNLDALCETRQRHVNIVSTILGKRNVLLSA